MSTYTVDLTIGSHTFAISSADPPIETAITVLDNLTVFWRFPEDAPRPVQPDPSSCSLGLLTRDVANLADVDVGTPLRVVVKSAGTLVAGFAGRVAQMSCTPRKLHNPDGSDGQAMIYQLDAVDYTVDLAELLVDFVRPAEPISNRLLAISDAIVAAGGLPIDYPPFSFDAATHRFAAINVAQQSALSILLDHLRQLTGVSNTDLPGLLLLTPHLSGAGTLTGWDVTWPILTTASLVWPPGAWTIIDGQLMIDPSGDSLLPARPGSPFTLPRGLSIDACRVELGSVEWIRSKFGAVDYVSVVGSNTTAIAKRAGARPIKLQLQSTLLWEPPLYNDVQKMADLYLPDPDVDRWAIDSVRWRPSDAELALLPFPLIPDPAAFTSPGPYEATAGLVAGPTAYYAPVVIREIPDPINPGSDLGYLAGTLSSAQVKISRGMVTVDVGIERKLPKNIDNYPNVSTGATWDDLQAALPAATWAVVDPRPSWYDARLAL